ncbi:MAG: alpha/beta fold hydrolase [Chloroflexi bacterium]|nr:alpha/beta fold hydrolase [Chloroflexota bacterium]
MPTAAINGVDLYYELHGDSGEPLVLVHGYTGDISDWRHQIPEFSRTHRVLILDLRGHGRSQAPPDRSAYTVPQMSQDVEALAEHVGLDRYHLLGHSMGGAVVQEIAVRSPQKLLSLTLQDTAHRFNLNADPLIAAWRDLRFRLAETEGMAAVAAMEQPLPPPPHMPAERLEETKDRLSRMSVDAFIGSWNGLAAWEGTEGGAHNIETPTLIIYGDLDVPLLIKASLKLAQLIPDAAVEVIPETGHSPQWERPALFNAALRRFLEQVTASPLGQQLA